MPFSCLVVWYGNISVIQGIGREYALALARRGLNIVLVSRNKQVSSGWRRLVT